MRRRRSTRARKTSRTRSGLTRTAPRCPGHRWCRPALRPGLRDGQELVAGADIGGAGHVERSIPADRELCEFFFLDGGDRLRRRARCRGCLRLDRRGRRRHGTSLGRRPRSRASRDSEQIEQWATAPRMRAFWHGSTSGDTSHGDPQDGRANPPPRALPSEPSRRDTSRPCEAVAQSIVSLPATRWT